MLMLKMESVKSRNVNVTSTFWKADPSILLVDVWVTLMPDPKLAKVNFKVLPKNTSNSWKTYICFKYLNLQIETGKQIIIQILNQIYFKSTIWQQCSSGGCVASTSTPCATGGVGVNVLEADGDSRRLALTSQKYLYPKSMILKDTPFCTVPTST